MNNFVVSINVVGTFRNSTGFDVEYTNTSWRSKRNIFEILFAQLSKYEKNISLKLIR